MMKSESSSPPTPKHAKRFSDARLEFALGTMNALNFPFMFIDSTHTIFMGNTAAASYFKIASDKIVATKCPRLHAEEYCSSCPLDKAIESGKSEEREIFDEKTQKWFSSVVYPVPFVSDEGNSMYILTFSDITARKIAEKNLVEEKNRVAVLANNFIDLILTMLELRDPTIGEHHRNVARIATAIAGEMGIDSFMIEGIRIASLVHDIGKISLPADILARPGRLSDIEYIYVQKHPQIGKDLLNRFAFPWPIAQIIYQHHERMDGSGYPDHLSSDQICLEARIIAIAEIIDSMTSHKPFRIAFTLEDTLKDIESKRGTKFDPDVVDACLRLFREKGFNLKM